MLDGGILFEAKNKGVFGAKDFNFTKFKSDMGRGLKVAQANQLSYLLISEKTIPSYIKTWLNDKGINFWENFHK